MPILSIICDDCNAEVKTWHDLYDGVVVCHRCHEQRLIKDARDELTRLEMVCQQAQHQVIIQQKLVKGIERKFKA